MFATPFIPMTVRTIKGMNFSQEGGKARSPDFQKKTNTSRKAQQ